MATELHGFKMTRVAGEDLSDNQYHFVKLDPSNPEEVIKVTAITDEPCGVQQGDAGVGEEVEIVVYGITKLVADGAISYGDELGTSADGEGDTIVSGTDTTVFKVGKAMEDASGAGTIFSALIDCAAPSRAA